MNDKINDIDFLYQEYIKNGKSCNYIADKINSSPGTVHGRLKKYGIIKIKKENEKLQIDDYLTKKYGELTPVRLSSPPINTNDKNAKYKKWVECKCSCGNITTKPLSALICNNIISCGCLLRRKGKNNPLFDGYEEISGKFFTHIKRTASGGTNKRKRICKEFNLSIKFLWELYIKQNKKCALSGLTLQFDNNKGLKSGNCSLDRINSSDGYTENNVQWVHKMVNIMKNKFDQVEFIKMCKLVSNNFNDGNQKI